MVRKIKCLTKNKSVGAILQVLAHTNTVRAAVENSEHDGLLRDVFIEMQKECSDPYDPSEFLSILTLHDFEGNASDFFCELLGRLDDIGESIMPFFLTETIDEICCISCLRSWKESSEFKVIDLNISERLTDSIREFRGSQMINIICQLCHADCEKEQTRIFSKLPSILAFTVAENAGQVEKNSFSYETDIILRDPNRKRQSYHLYGIVVLIKGDYISYIRHEDKWQCFSDHDVSYVAEIQHKEVPSMFFYKKEDPEVRAIADLENQSFIASILHILAETDALQSAIPYHSCKRDQICGGNVLKKYMKEIWAHSRDPYDASCFVRITKSLLEEEKKLLLQEQTATLNEEQIVVEKQNKALTFYSSLINGLARCDGDAMGWIFICGYSPKFQCLHCSNTVCQTSSPCIPYEMREADSVMDKIQSEYLHMECSNCKQNRKFVTISEFESLPEVLTFQLEISLENDGLVPRPMNYETTLYLKDLSGHHSYSLYGVIKRVESREQDKYLSFIRQGNTWLESNSVCVQKIFFQKDILLFYERQKHTKYPIEEQPNLGQVIQPIGDVILDRHPKRRRTPRVVIKQPRDRKRRRNEERPMQVMKVIQPPGHPERRTDEERPLPVMKQRFSGG